MLTFNGDPALKEKMVERAREHRLGDRITQGIYWDWHEDEEQWRGCAIGCLATDLSKQRVPVHGAVSGARRIEDHFSIPACLAFLAEAGFEGAPSSEAAKWPEEFAAAIPVGVELDPATACEWFKEWSVITAESDEFARQHTDTELDHLYGSVHQRKWNPEARQFVLDKLASITPDEDKETLKGIVDAVEERATAEKKAVDAIAETVRTQVTS